MAKKNAIVSIENDNGTLRFAVAGAGEFNIDTATLPEEIKARAMIHGLVQKVSDAAAIAKAELTGDAATDAATKFNAMQAVAERLIGGEWSKRTGEGSGPVAGVIFRAFAEWAKGMAKAKKAAIPTEEQLRAVYDSKDRAGQLALRNVPEIATIIERMKSEKGGAAAKVDADSLLSELGL